MVTASGLVALDYIEHRSTRLVARRCERLHLAPPLLAEGTEAVHQQQSRRIVSWPCQSRIFVSGSIAMPR